MSEIIDFNAIAHDLDLCDLGEMLTTGARRRKYTQHRKACFDAIRAANEADGLNASSDDELLRELLA